MTAPGINDFYSGGGGGGPSVSWKDKPIGSKISGTIVATYEPQQQTDPSDGSLVFYKKGPRAGQPKMSARIDIQTEFRNWEMCKPPQDDPDAVDDGLRGLYVQGFMQGAVKTALRKAGADGAPEVNGWLSVELVERRKNENPALNPINVFEAEYRLPSAKSTADFYSGDPAPPANGLSAPAAAVNNPLPQKPESLAQAAWDAMPDDVKRSVAATMATMSSTQDDKPPF